MPSYRGRTALITGASTGIGAAFAHALAGRGMNVVLVARTRDALEQLAADLTQRYQVAAVALPADLSQPGAALALVAELDGQALEIDMLLNNAGFGLHGAFEALTLDQQLNELQVNTAALVALTHALAPRMLSRASGTIINIASTLAFQPDPYMAVYGATKAFVLSFTAALAEEYRGRGVRVLALCPGATATPFYRRSGGEATFNRMRMRTPEDVVATGLRALEGDQVVAIDGVRNRLLFGFLAPLPKAVSARILGRALGPRQRP
ncbi:MAG TPA: SDR family oxidoreductase [Ktedonobacterales bacterium]